jgi:hypothetical protein
MGARRTRFIGPGGIGLVSALLLVLGVVGLVGGVAYWVNGLTQAGADVTVPVQLLPASGSTVAAADPDRVRVPVTGLPADARVSADAGDLGLTAWGSTIPEYALARADTLLLGLAVAFAAYLLIPLLRSVQEGHPFDDGNARRIAGLTVALLVAGWLGPFLTRVGSLLVIDRLGVGGVDSGLQPGAMPELGPLLLAAVLLAVLAEAFRRGEQISADVDGLV